MRLFLRSVLCHLLVGLMMIVWAGASAQAQQDPIERQMVADRIAAHVAAPIRDMDRDQLAVAVRPDVEERPSILALTVTRSIGSERLLTYFRQNDLLTFNQPIPEQILESEAYKAQAYFEGREVGTVTVYFASPAAAFLTAEEQAWLKDHPVIRLGSDRGWPPFESIDAQGRYRGLSADYIKRLEGILGIRFQPPAARPWAENIAMMQARDLDILTAVAPTEARSEYMEFTDPYMTWPNVIAVREGTEDVSSLADLSGKRVGAVAGYAIEELLREKHPDFEVVAQKDVAGGLLALSTGSIDAYVDSFATINYYTHDLQITNIKVVAPTPYIIKIAFGVRKDWPELARILNKTLAAIPVEERERMLTRLGLGAEAAYAQPTAADPESFLTVGEAIVLALVVLIALAAIIWLAWLIRGQRRSFLKSLRGKSLMFLLLAFALVGGLTLWAVELIGQQVSARLGEDLAERRVLWHRERVIGAVNREIALTIQMAESQVLKNWAGNEANPLYRAQARQELQAFRDNFASHTIFAAFTKSLKFYYADDSVDRINLEPVDTLARDNPDDSWFFDTLRDPRPYQLNVDHNADLGVTNLWINHVVRSGGRALGVIGTGVPLSEFIEEFTAQKATGIDGLMMDAEGILQTEILLADQDDAGATADGGLVALPAIWDRLGSEADQETLRQQMRALKQKDDAASTFFLDLNGGDRLVAMTYLAPLDW